MSCSICSMRGSQIICSLVSRVLLNEVVCKHTSVRMTSRREWQRDKAVLMAGSARTTFRRESIWAIRLDACLTLADWRASEAASCEVNV